MSTIYGILNRTGIPVSFDCVDDMHRAFCYWSPDASGTWFGDGIVVGHAMLWNTPQSKNEHFPLENGQYVLTMDARLDNRAELAASLGFKEKLLSEITDSEFVLAAYRKWEEDCPKYLIGDFVFAIWDKTKHQIFCARDHLGVRPFYYHLADPLFVFGNDLKGMVAHPAISTILSDKAVANFLVNGILNSRTQTLFNDIQKLPPAHSMTVSADSVLIQKYWRPADSPKVKLADTEEYAHRLKELVEQAVYDRLRTDYPVTSHLSGGLDSSSIAVIAARKLQKEKKQLLAFNWLHKPREFEDAQNFEWANSIAIASVENIKHSYISMDAEGIAEYMRDNSVAYGDTAGLWYENLVRKAAQQQGSRTILSGWGDELATYHSKAYWANMLCEGNLLELFKGIFFTSNGRKKRIKPALRMLYHSVLTAFVPRRLYHLVPKSKTYESDFPFQVIKDNFLPSILQEELACRDVTPQPRPTIKMEMLDYLQNGNLQGRMESWASGAFKSRIEYSYPLLDKRVVEFVLGVPAIHFVHNQTGRYLFRKAMEGIIPNEILWEPKKAEQNRVGRLVDISIVAFRQLIKELQQEKVNSSYIDLNRLELLADDESSEKDMIFLAMAVWLPLSVVFAEKLK